MPPEYDNGLSEPVCKLFIEVIKVEFETTRINLARHVIGIPIPCRFCIHLS